MKAKFGPAGNCKSFYDEGYKSSKDAPKWLKERGLELYEYSFSRGVRLKDESAALILEEVRKHDIEISVHAPYFINLASEVEGSHEKNEKYIMDSLSMARKIGAKFCVFHPGSQLTLSREKAFENVYNNFKKILAKAKEKGYTDLVLSPETMGKSKQIGSVDEILKLSALDDMVIPTFDIGHINSVTQGGLSTKDDYRKLFDKTIAAIGEYKTKNLHIHFSKIEYGDKGEIRHLTLEDEKYGPNYEDFLEVVAEYDLHPTIICESKEIMAIDALKLKNHYMKIKEEN